MKRAFLHDPARLLLVYNLSCCHNGFSSDPKLTTARVRVVWCVSTGRQTANSHADMHLYQPGRRLSHSFSSETLASPSLPVEDSKFLKRLCPQVRCVHEWTRASGMKCIVCGYQ